LTEAKEYEVEVPGTIVICWYLSQEPTLVGDWKGEVVSRPSHTAWPGGIELPKLIAPDISIVVSSPSFFVRRLQPIIDTTIEAARAMARNFFTMLSSAWE
jgi:hypothetical protein